MRRRRRVKWFEFRIDGRRWRVWLSFGKINGTDGFKDCSGITNNEKCYIVLSIRQHNNMVELHKTLGHELVHAACGPSDMNSPIERMALAAEEFIADRCEQNLVPLFISIGLQLPALPAGVVLGT